MTSAAAIDVHGHGVPEPFVAEIVRSGLGGVEAGKSDSKYILQFPQERPLRPVAGVMMDFAGRGRWLDDQEVARQVVAPWLDVQGQQLPAPDGPAWVRLLNDCMAQAVAGTGARLSAHATLHLANPAAAAAELERAHREHGMTSAMIPTHLPAGFLDESRFDALWEAAAALHMPVVLHPPTMAPSSPAFERYPKLSTLARTVDTTVIVAALITTGVLDRFPDLKLVAVHGGGFLPYQIGRLDQAFEKDGGALPSERLRRMLFDTAAMSTDAVRMLVGYVGAEHVMVGSDYAATSAQPNWQPGRLLANVQQSGADATGRELILRANAGRLFRLQY